LLVNKTCDRIGFARQKKEDRIEKWATPTFLLSNRNYLEKVEA